MADPKRVQLGPEPGASALAILVREAVTRRGGVILSQPASDGSEDDRLVAAPMTHDELVSGLREVLDEAEVHAVFEIRVPAT